MSDMDDGDLGKFLEDDFEDKVKPIDMDEKKKEPEGLAPIKRGSLYGDGAPEVPKDPGELSPIKRGSLYGDKKPEGDSAPQTEEAKQTEGQQPQEGNAQSAEDTEDTGNPAPPLPDAGTPPPPLPEQNLPPTEDEKKDELFLPPDEGEDGFVTGAPEDQDFIKDSLPPEPQDLSVQKIAEENRNYVHKGDFVDLKAFKPQLNFMQIGCGWDVKSLEGEPPDYDVSLFLLDKDGQTRVDEDFVFYNNTNVLDGAIRHRGDSRTGAGEGDDETIIIDLNGIPFDVMKIMIVFSVYDQDGKGHHLQMVRNVFLRFVDGDDRLEIVCYKIPDEEFTTSTAMKIACLVREGPLWFLEPMAEPVVGGLARVATSYGIIVQELQSTGDDDF